jgi:hypothetical protein
MFELLAAYHIRIPHPLHPQHEVLDSLHLRALD